MPLFSVRVAAQSTVIATASMILFHGFTVAFSSVGRIYTQSLFSQIPLRSTTTRARFSNVIPVPVQSIFYPSVNSVIRESFSRRNLFSSKQHEDKDATSSRSTTAVSHKFSVPAMEVETTTTDGIQYNDYERWVRRLYATNMFHPVKLGLENMRLLHKLLGNPMDDPNRLVVHVAGTNGKGSVCLKIANALRNQERKSPTSNSEKKQKDIRCCKVDKKHNVGLFCSPHVSSFRERMQVNGKMITEEEVVELLPQIYDLCLPENNDIPATFFEITTALAFLFFAKRGADVVVLETGLGGRLDATNVIKMPALSIITSIGLEHTKILGDTIELIAREKGGIFKKDCPVLVAKNCPHSVLLEVAREKGAGPYYEPNLVQSFDETYGSTVIVEEGEKKSIAFTDYDVANQEVAKAALILLERLQPKMFGKQLELSEVEELVSIRPPCRFEYFQKDNATVILDVAHNPEAMKYLVHKLQRTFSDNSFRFVVGMSSDKDLGQCAKTLLSATSSCNKTPYIHLVEAAHPRAASLESILDADSDLKDTACYDFEDRSISKQVIQALDKTKETKGEILIICGSVFLMAEAREAIGINEPRDSNYIAEMAGAGIRHTQENFGNTKI